MPNAFGEPVPDQTGELRLQLMQVRDQRDAFKALAHRDVLAVIREAHESSLNCTISELQDKVARLIKAGTAMGMCLPDTDEANAAYRAFEYAAKGGKPSV